LFEAHRALGARIVPFAGWSMPVFYTSILEEHHAVRNHVGLFDVSHMGQLEIRGSNAGSWVNSLITRDLAKVARGRARYSLCCVEDGGVLDDLIVYRLEDDSIWIVCNASRKQAVVAHMLAHKPEDVQFTDRSTERALIAIQGPQAKALMQSLSIACELARYAVAEAQWDGQPLRIARTGYTGEDGFEVAYPAERAPRLFEALLDKGKALGVKPVGLGARDTLRLEAALPLYGQEIDLTTHPFEAGLGWVVDLDKADFIGKSRLSKIASQPLHRRLVGLQMIGRGIARHDYPVHNAAGAQIGIVTSGSPSPTLGKNIALAYLDAAHCTPQSPIEVEIRGQRISAEVVPTPFYKRSN